MVFLPIVHRNNCQITHLIWNLGAHSTLGSSVREARGALLSNPIGYTMPILFLLSPDAGPAGNGKQSQPSECRLPVSRASSSSARGHPCRIQGSCTHRPLSPLRPGLLALPLPGAPPHFLHRLAGRRGRHANGCLQSYLHAVLGWASAKPQRDLL